MSNPQPPSASSSSGPAGNATPARRAELQFLLAEEPVNLRTVFGGGGLAWLFFGILLGIAFWARPPIPGITLLDPEPIDITDIVFLPDPGPGGGGGGGGNKSPEPPKTVQTPAIKPPEPAPPPPVPVPNPEPPPPDPTPDPPAEIPALPTNQPVAVVASAPPTDSPSLGAGLGPGAGTNPKGTGGIGSGDKDGLGSGTGPGCCEGVFKPGSGATNPVPINSPRPGYTSEAMLRRVQGVAVVGCIVTKTGTTEQCKVVKSIDSNNFGLDNEAVKAASRFRFKPALYKGEPVAMMVNIELTFTMR